MPRPDILESPPSFTQEHTDWVTAKIAAMEAAVYQVSADVNIATEVNKVKGAKAVLNAMIAAQQNYQGA